MISPIVPAAGQTAFASSVSMCIASAKLGFTRTTTSPKTSERPSDSILTETTCLSVRPYFSASAGVAWICLFAAITPQSISTSPLGPTSLQEPVPAMSPLSRMGATTPMLLASVSESSTWVAGRMGPRIETAGN